jgi:riboflavin transporter FmnP
MLIEFAVPFFPSFLKIDASDLPALIGSMAMGPLAGVLIELVKNLLHLLRTSTGGVGEMANFLVGSAFVLPVGIISKKSKNLKGYLMGVSLGAIFMTAAACICNYYILIPLYSAFMPLEAILEMAKTANSAVVDLKTLIIFAVAPFNLLKAFLVSLIGYRLFRLIIRLIRT